MGLNYGLSADILNRVKEAGKTRRPEFGLGDAISGIGQTITDRAEAGQEAMAGWDEGFAMQGDRGSWASGELYDQFQKSEAKYRDEYLQAVKRGDKQTMARLLSDQGNRSSALAGWKDTMETAKEINDGVGWGDNLLKPEDKYILGVLAKNDGTAKMRMGERGEMVFDIPTEEGGIRTVTRREIDEMVARGTNPLDLELKVMDGNAAFTKAGLNGDMFNLEEQIRRNRLSIDNDKLPALMNQSFGGASFRDHIKSHPDFKAAYVDGGFMSSIDPTPDGELTSADMAGFSKSDMELVIDEMEKNPETAKDYVADWMGRINQQNWQKGVDEKTRLEEEERRRNWKDSRTSYEKNLDRAERDRLEKIETRKKPLVIGGQPWGHVAVDQYFKDETSGEWVWNNNPGGSTPVLVRVKDHVKKRGGDYNAIIAELERLQFKKTPADTTAQDLIDKYS